MAIEQLPLGPTVFEEKLAEFSAEQAARRRRLEREARPLRPRVDLRPKYRAIADHTGYWLADPDRRYVCGSSSRTWVRVQAREANRRLERGETVQAINASYQEVPIK